MESFDTNVVVRLLVRDDEEQCARAESAWRSAVAADGAWISTVVLVEVSWVLRGAYKFDRGTVATALRRLIWSAGVSVEDPALLDGAIDAFEAGAADFSDYVILHLGRQIGAIPLRTFDQVLAEEDGAELC